MGFQIWPSVGYFLPLRQNAFPSLPPLPPASVLHVKTGRPLLAYPLPPSGRWRAAGAGWGLSPAWVSGAVSGHRDGDQGTRRRKGWGVILPVKTRVKTCQGASRSGWERARRRRVPGLEFISD